MTSILKGVDIVLHAATLAHEGLSNFSLICSLKIMFLDQHQFSQQQLKIRLKELFIAHQWQDMEILKILS